jgi:hypothetical protein
VSAATYTRDDLLAAAREAGHAPSSRLVTDWVALGLLDKPTKRGLGRGLGTIATWPQQQRNLFLLLLEKRRDLKGITPLYNLPVALWAYFGDAYAPLRQARLAHANWAGASTHTRSMRTARQNARSLLDQIIDPQAPRSARAPLEEHIARIASGAEFDRDGLLSDFTREVQKRPPSTPARHPLLRISPEIIVDRIDAWRRALPLLTSLDDDFYRFARTTLVQSDEQYNQLASDLQRDPRSTAARPRDWQQRIPSVCLDLLTVIGMLLKAADRLPVTSTAS